MDIDLSNVNLTNPNAVDYTELTRPFTTTANIVRASLSGPDADKVQFSLDTGNNKISLKSTTGIGEDGLGNLHLTLDTVEDLTTGSITFTASIKKTYKVTLKNSVLSNSSTFQSEIGSNVKSDTALKITNDPDLGASNATQWNTDFQLRWPPANFKADVEAQLNSQISAMPFSSKFSVDLGATLKASATYNLTETDYIKGGVDANYRDKIFANNSNEQHTLSYGPFVEVGATWPLSASDKTKLEFKVPVKYNVNNSAQSASWFRGLSIVPTITFSW